MKTRKSKALTRPGAGVMPGAALASGLLSPLAFAAPGDLDPGFADLGRLVPSYTGPAWSIEPREDDSLFLAGGNFEPYCSYYYYYCGWSSHRPGNHASNFVARVDAAGSVDPAFVPERVAGIQVFDFALQPGGEMIAVGRNANPVLNSTRLAVFRLLANGSLDTTFGDGGIFRLDADDDADSHAGNSVLLDPDGRIVVAGSRNDRLLVLRLLPDGSVDGSFGNAGIVNGPDNLDVTGMRATVLRSGAGYRVSASNAAGCQVVALTAGGAPDTAFGNAGIATVTTSSGPSVSCSALVNYSDGRLLAVGKTAYNAFAARLLADGQEDPAFSADVVGTMTAATSVALDNDDSVIVAGTGVDGATIMRLLANGELDDDFGNAGSTVIDLASHSGAAPVVHDMRVRADGSLIAAGGNRFGYYSNQAFVAKLLGPGSGGSPGVLGFTVQDRVLTAEGEGEAVIQVRRTGGDAGSVSVAYEIETFGWDSARPGKDFDDVSGRLAWHEGDRSAKEIRVPILADDEGEEQEAFDVVLSDIEGGAGLAKRTAHVSIEPDGRPYGQFEIVPAENWAKEESKEAFVYVYRNFYDSGVVSVTVNAVNGTAISGEDFMPRQTTLTWTDGDTSIKGVAIPLIDDDVKENSENFRVSLSNPTGGAVLGPRSGVFVTIAASDSDRNSGGGALGVLSLFLLGLLRALRPVLLKPSSLSGRHSAMDA